jgi:hypothetical protein
MATGTVKWYGNVPLAFFNKEIDLLTDTIMVSLHNVSYVPAQDTDDYADDLTNEMAGTGNYSTGGQQILNDTLTYTAGSNVMKYDGDDMSWASSTITNARVAVIYCDTGGAASTDPLIGYTIFDANVSTSSGTLAIAWDANGILTLTAAA